jgi:hypothetical protein
MKRTRATRADDEASSNGATTRSIPSCVTRTRLQQEADDAVVASHGHMPTRFDDDAVPSSNRASHVSSRSPTLGPDEDEMADTQQDAATPSSTPSSSEAADQLTASSTPTRSNGVRTTPTADESESSTVTSEGTPLPIARTRRILRVRRSTRRTCHLDELVTDEMQCVMQLLDARSLLRFARCSRRLLSDADSDVAWKYQSAFHIEFTSHDLTIGDRIRHSLLRHAPAISVDWTGRGSAGEADSTDAEVSGLLRIPRMTQLSLARRLSHAHYHHVITHSGLDSLRELNFSRVRDLPVGFVDHLVRLTSLTSLHIGPRFPPLDTLTSLPRLCRLSNLSICDAVHAESRYSQCHVIPQCAQLTDLNISTPGFYGPRFRPFFTQLGHQLQRLTIRDFNAGGLGDFLAVVPPVPPEDYIAAFQSLIQLRFLCLERVIDVDDMLRHLHHAPALQMLVVRPTRFQSSTWPAVDIVQQLMDRTSAALHIEVVPRKSDGFPPHPPQQYASLDPTRFTYRAE